MGSPRRRQETAPVISKHDEEGTQSGSFVRIGTKRPGIKRLGRAILLARWKASQVSDWVCCNYYGSDGGVGRTWTRMSGSALAFCDLLLDTVARSWWALGRRTRRGRR
jgi:hypothetical protein